MHGDDTEYDYHAHILAPNADNRQMGDSLAIYVLFESHAGETVHHVNVRIYQKGTNKEVYNKPVEAHIHETSGEYHYRDTFALSVANGISDDSSWIMEARVWGHEPGEGEAMEAVEFYVLPN